MVKASLPFFLIFSCLSFNTYPQSAVYLKLIPVNDITKESIFAIKDSIEIYFNVCSSISDISECMNVEKLMSSEIIYAKPLFDSLVKKNTITDSIKFIFITDKKLSILELPKNEFFDELKYLIRGLTSSIPGEFGIISTYKLKKESTDNLHFQNLLVKTMRHEVGHLLGLHHCRNDSCLMKSAYDPVIFQNIDYYLCDKCVNILDPQFISD